MAIKINAAQWRARPGMAPLLDALGAEAGLTRYVGGAVRDSLLGASFSDLDLATRLAPDEVTQRLEAAGVKAVPTGIEHGTITAVSAGQTYEVTTLRRDVTTDGRRATVAFTDDWQEDAARRDFTMNALSADPVTGDVFDYFDGLADVGARRVRFIGEPLQRIAEDHLRILRFFRFHARFGSGVPDGPALAACAGRANDLMALSRERIADELLKLLALPDPAPTVGIMLKHGILAPVVPEIAPNHVRTLEALIEAEQQSGLAAIALRRLAALLPRDPATAESIGARLKLSTKARKRLACAAQPDDRKSALALVYWLGGDCAVDRLLLSGRVEDAREASGWAVPRMSIGGGDLIARGLEQGPIVALTLRRVEEEWVARGFPEGAAFETIVSDAIAKARAG